MAGIVDKFKRMWDAPDDEYEYDEYGYADEETRWSTSTPPQSCRWAFSSPSASVRKPVLLRMN